MAPVYCVRISDTGSYRLIVHSDSHYLKDQLQSVSPGLSVLACGRRADLSA